METLVTFLYVVLGLLVRLAIPIAGTVVLVIFLRKLDERWQTEAELHAHTMEKPECWKIKGCSPQQIETCEAHTSQLPCWQANRLPNGYLNEQCLSCEVFAEAPIPTIKPEPRRL